MRHLSILSYLITTFLFVSCNNDLFEDVTSKNTRNIKMSAPDFIADVTTRSVLNPSENGTSFTWATNDVVGVYSYSKGLASFFIDNESISKDGTTAVFKGEGFDLKANSNYYALYPYNPTALDKHHVSVDYKHQEVESIGDFNQLSNYDFMISQGETDSNGEVVFNFNHLGCVIDLSIQIPVSASYTKVRIESESGSDNCLIIGGTVDLTSANASISSNGVQDKDTVLMVSLNAPEGLACKEDSTIHLYLMMPPQDLSGQNVMIRLVDSMSNWYSAIVPGKNMKAGYTYHYTISNESNFGFTGSGSGLPNDFEIELQSSYSYGNSYKHEAVLVDATNMYSIGGFGVSRFDISTPQSLQLLATNSLQTKYNMLSRSITQNGDFLYVCKRSPLGGMDEVASPEIALDFDSHIQSFETDASTTALSNKSNFNAIFSELRLNSVDPSSVKTVFIFKAYLENNKYRNCIRFQDADKVYYTIFNKSYNTEAEALSALSPYYENANGDACRVNWDNVEKGRTTITNLVLNIATLGEYDVYAHSGNAYVNEMGEGCPNRGKYSANLVGSSPDGSFAILKKRINKNVSSGELSFWLKVSNLNSGYVELPLLGDGNNTLLSLKVARESGSNTSVSLNYNGNISANRKSIDINEWVNFKILFTNSNVELYYRSKECPQWQLCIQNNSALQNSISMLLVGIISYSENAKINIDDFYYNSEDLDACSYINGQIDVVKKSDLSVVSRYYLDLKPTGSAISGNTLLVNFLKGYNIYDVSNPQKPILKYAYRSPDWKEFQGCQIYDANGKKYAFLCNYSLGFTIVDITNVENPKNIVVDGHSTLMKDGNSLYKKGFNFDVVVDYPYAYATYCTRPDYLGTQFDYKGIITYDLRDLNNINMTVSEIPSEFCYNNYIENRICKLGRKLYISCAEKGFAVFDIKENGIPTFDQMVMPESNSNIHSISAVYPNFIVAGSDYNTSLNKNLYIYKIY